MPSNELLSTVRLTSQPVHLLGWETWFVPGHAASSVDFYLGGAEEEGGRGKEVGSTDSERARQRELGGERASAVRLLPPPVASPSDVSEREGGRRCEGSLRRACVRASERAMIL